MPLTSSSTRPTRRTPRNTNSRRKKRRWFVSLFKWLAITGLLTGILCVFGVGVLYFKLKPELPDVQSLRQVQLQLPLRIYTTEGDLIAEYGEKRREPVLISSVPEILKNSVISAEDARFYQHPGVDYQGLLRAVYYLAKTGKKGPGGSTITMQVARNFFLSNEKTYLRKVKEIFLSFKIEDELSKDEILQLYINKIYLGNRSYGFAAAARVYYGKKIDELSIAEAAMLAGLPKAPSAYNPLVNPSRALLRRDYVLRRLNDLGHITDQEFAEAKAMPVTASLHYSKPEAEANYVAEMVRKRIEQLFGNRWATGGFNVFTSIRANDQRAANTALRNALFDYEARHGYRGPIAQLDAETLSDPVLLAERLSEQSTRGEMHPAVVIEVDEQQATVVTEEGEEHVLALEHVEWARERLDVDSRGPEITQVDSVLAVGDVIQLLLPEDGSVRFVQEPKIEGAFVALDPRTGDIIALVGGFDYYRSKFNRAIQARRQPGSTLKPFIYSAALEAGDTAATIYNDAPVVFHDAALEGEWRPSNYSGRFYGPTRLREALVNSRNLVSVRVLREIGVPYAIEYAKRFGFRDSSLPADLSLALGNASVTPIEMTAAFAVFANSGYKVPPHFITRIEDPSGQVLYRAPKVVLCEDCVGEDDFQLLAEVDAVTRGAEEKADDTAETEPVDADADEVDLDGESVDVPLSEEMVRLAELDIVNAPRVIDKKNAFIMGSMMREVVSRGTARKAAEALGRKDIAGKTGTTNNQLDAWFTGFNSQVVAAAWIGSDGLDPLGRGEAGGVAALPMWTAFMAKALDGVPEDELDIPEGIQTIRINRKTGEPDRGDNTMLELFIEGTAPEDQAELPAKSNNGQGNGGGTPRVPKSKVDKANELETLF